MISADTEDQADLEAVAGVDLAVCILFYEKADQTIECIKSFLSSGVDIYVLNNNSSALATRTLWAFCQDYQQVRMLESPNNLGVGGGRNYLLYHTAEEWLLFVDSDVTVKTPGWLWKFGRHVSRQGATEVFIPRLYNVHEKQFVTYKSIRIVQRKAMHDQEINDDTTNTFPGGASFVNRRLFDRLGPYDDEMFVGFEDYEICIRAIKQGSPVRARLVHDIELIHEHQRPENSQDRNALLTRYDTSVLEASFKQITDKHGLVLQSNWKTWARNQVADMLEQRDANSCEQPSRGWIARMSSRICSLIRRT